MTDTARDILEQAKQLSHYERLALVQALCDTFADEPESLSPEWTAEVAERIAQLERGEVQAVPWSEVESRIRQTLGEH